MPGAVVKPTESGCLFLRIANDMAGYLPYHHRHRRLLPPGMLALAGLLWLGGTTLHRWMPLSRQCVLQLTVPPRPKSDFIWPMSGEELLGRQAEPVWRYSRLAHFRHWSTLKLGQSRWSDSLAVRRMEGVVRTMAAEEDATDTGLRIYFGPRARYASLVQTLNLMQRYNIKKYMLDLHHGPATFYAFTGDSRPRRPRWQRPLRTPFPARKMTGSGVPTALAPTISWWTRRIRLDTWPPAMPAYRELLTATAWQMPLALLSLMLAIAGYELVRWRKQRQS